MTADTRDPDATILQALRESEEKYHFLAETIPVQIWTALPDGRLDYVSEQTAHYFGLTPQRLLADGWQHVVHADDLPLAVERWTHALRTGETYEVEFRLKAGSGEYGWHLARAVPQRNASGAVVRWFGTNTNIEEQRTHQRQVEMLLAQLQEQNRLLALEAEIGTVLVGPGSLSDALQACAEAVVLHLDAAFARVWTLDAAGTILELRASAGLYTHLDGPHGRVPVGHLKIGRIAAERRPHFTNQVVGDPQVGDQAWAVREGMIAFAGCPILFGDKVVGVIAAFARHPLSEATTAALGSVANALAQSLQRRHVEEKVQRAHREAEAARADLHSLFMQAPTPICILRGPEHTFALANPAYMQLVGTRRAIVGLPVRQALKELAGQGFYEILDGVYETGERFVGRDVPATFDRQGDGVGEEAFVTFVYEAFRNLEGGIAGIFVIAFDVTDTVRARENLQGMLQERDRLLAITEEARSKADVASRAKDEFLATASHELRTPLNAILGWARLLRSGSLDPSAFLRGLETIERNAKAQVQLIEDILDGSRIITGKLHLEIRSADLTSIVQAAIDTVRPAAAARNISLEVRLDRAASRLQGDPDRLQQVVWNLVNNALKFTPKGGAVEVRVERAGTSIELSVKDNGQGIAPEFLPHVFERFRQADGSTTRRSGGLGLGLALVRHLVEAHGGSVRAESEGEGLGSTFVVTLPVQAVFPERVDSDRLTPTSAAASRLSLAPNSLSGVLVLVIDDERDARDLVAVVLRAQGANVLVAASAEAALEVLKDHSPTVLISDIGMPLTDGYALIGSVRALSTGAAKTPAIALTAYAREEDRRRALEAGFQSYLAKPVEPEALVRLVGALAQQTDV
jgi:PAS domain S-box-containing protein